MNTMRRCISVIVSITMLFSMLTVPVLAEEGIAVVEQDVVTEEIAVDEGNELIAVDDEEAVESGAETEETQPLETEVTEASDEDSDISNAENANSTQECVELNAYESIEEIQSIYDDAVHIFGSDTSDGIVLEGEGTKQNPYKIYTEEELISFSVGDFEDGLVVYWELENDIVLTADTWAPIGAYTPFSGVFDGKGHTISSSKLFQSTAMSGIFGQNAGVIKNLNIDVTIEEVATNTGTLCAVNNGTIDNCHVTGSITTSENKNIGGLVGLNERGTIINCSSSVVIQAPNSTVGGLVGYNRDATIKYSWTYNKTIENEEEELVYGNIVGGLVGYANNNSSETMSLISNCYTLGKIRGGSKVGGLIGYCDVSYGNRGYIRVEYCYAKGVITQGTNKGGITSGINTNDRNIIRYCYFNNVNDFNKLGFGVSLLEIADRETFYDWNFDTVWAIDSEINNGYPYINYTGEEEINIDGEGTEESPYIVTNEKQLCYIASEKLPLSAHYKLESDITVTANFWTPIACDGSDSFSGVFDGNGKYITGVHTNDIYYDYIGLFGKNEGTIKNLSVQSWFSGNKRVGGLVGYNNGVIENCNTQKSDEEYYISGTDTVGGLVGYSENGTITKCHSSATVNAPGYKVGGLIGYSCNSVVKYCYSTSNVTGGDAGGLIGYVLNNTYERTSLISNCYAMGKITGTGSSGGLIGVCDVAYGNRGYITVEYCYARGLVSVAGNNGGLIGHINSSDRNVIRYCYYNIANTGNKFGFGVKASNIKLEDTLYGWDFENIWKIEKGINSGYPHLDVRGEPTKNILQGNGEEDRPYLIYTEEDLRSLVDDVYGLYDLSVKHFYKLMNDIEVKANFWTPIGFDGTNVFNGIFDGNGHTISGIKLSNSHYTHSGLFAKNSGIIKNLTVKANISGKIVGAVCGKNTGTIENCSSFGEIVSDENTTEKYCGGISGINDGTVTLCHSSVTVICEGWEAGGIAGRSTNSRISYSYTDGSITGRYAGGLVGRLHNTDSSFVTTVSCCYSSAKIKAGECGGGLIGVCDVAYGNRGYIAVEYCYAVGKVDSDDVGGGLVGSHNSLERNQIRYSYYNCDNAGNYIGFAASLGQLADKTLYYMWDFENVWKIEEGINNGYPYLDVRGKTKVHYLDGYGDEDDPYIIETEEDLWALVVGTYSLTDKFYYQLQNDIEITAEHWTPIGGNGKNVFNGIFDGNGYTISGLKLYNSEFEYQGLFAYNTGTIKNLNVAGNVAGRKYTGLLCAYNTGVIENCASTGNVSTVVSGNEIFVGGLVGINVDGGKISYSHSSVNVEGKDWDTGGLVGRNQNTASIANCYANGTVTGGYVGGLVGRNHGMSSTTTVIENSYADCVVTGYRAVGGLVGITSTNYNNNYPTAINNCYSLSKVSNIDSTLSNCGGLVGHSDHAVYNSILSSYYNQTITGLSDIDRGTPLDDVAMKLQSSYVGWDFSKVWEIDSECNNGYPTLIDVELFKMVPVTGIKLNQTEVNVGVGDSIMLNAEILPSDCTNKELNWVSESEKIATVSSGKIVGVSEGTTTVTVTSIDGNFSAMCVVNVTNSSIPAEGITLDMTSAEVIVGNELVLTATVNPANVTDRTLKIEISGTSVITTNMFEWVADENGQLKITLFGVEAGDAVVKVSTANGHSASCNVKVKYATGLNPISMVKVSSGKSVSGDTVTLTVDLVGNAGFASLGLEIGYDDSVMTLTNVANESTVGGIFTTAQSITANPYNIGWDNFSNITYNGTLVTLTFEIKDNAPDGVYPVTVDFYKGVNGTYKDGYDVNYDENFQPFNLIYEDGFVEVASYMPGDVSGDGAVNNRDVTYLLRHLAGWTIEGIVEEAMDVDGSGTVNNRDVTTLLRYLAGWDIELK